MKSTAPPIPVRSVVCLPRWLLVGGVALSGGAMLAGIGMAGYAFLATPNTTPGNWYGGLLGGALGCIGGGAGGLFGALADWRRRLPPTLLFAYLQQDRVHPYYRRVFWPALLVFVVGMVLGCIWNEPAIWHGMVQTGGILAFTSGSFEVIRRHTTHRTRILFALYADGALDPADTAAIDAARRQDPRFDAAVRDYQAVAARVARLGAIAE